MKRAVLQRTAAALLVSAASLAVAGCASEPPLVMSWNAADCPLGPPFMVSCESQRAIVRAEQRDGPPLNLEGEAALAAFLAGEGRWRIISLPAYTSEGVFWGVHGAYCPEAVALRRVELSLASVEAYRAAYRDILAHNHAVIRSGQAPETSCEPREDTSTDGVALPSAAAAPQEVD